MDPALTPLLIASVPNPALEMDNQSEMSLSPDRSPVHSRRQSLFLNPDTCHAENRMLKTRLYQQQQELQVEQETVATLRKKLNNLEKDRLDALGKANEQVAKTDSELARMRAAVEKGEAVRQNLEYEMAKLRREVGHEKRSGSEREALIGEVNDSLKQKVNELSHQIEQLCQEMTSSKVKSQEELAKMNLVLNEKELHISSLRSEKDILEAEKDKAESALTHQETTVSDLEKRIKESEDERRNNSESIRRQVGETELLKEREQRFMRDLEAAMRRIKALEEGIEAERAAHLESKFNSEIVQLRIRDLEGALDVEKTSKSEALECSEKLASQIKELQQLYEDSQREAVQSREKLEKDLLLKCVLPATRAEKEYALINQQLQTDLEKKNHVIGKLSKQLELHQKNFDELKEELNKAKKRQIFLEETYGGSMRELELLLNNFNLDTEGQRKPKPSSKTKKKDSSLKNVQPSIVLENLRHTLLEYKQRLDQTATELTKLKSQYEQLAKECDSYKGMIWSKDKALENTSQSMTRSGKELQRLKSDVTEQGELLRTSRTNVDLLQKDLDKEKSVAADLRNQLVKVATKCKTDEQLHVESLHGLYQQLLTGRLSASSNSNNELRPMRFSWNELLVSVQEEVANMMHSYHRNNDKLQHVETLQQSKETAFKDMQAVHEEQLNKLADVAEDKGQILKQQKAELEEHYGQLLAEMNHRQKKLQSLTDQAWEKVRVSGTIQQGLEAEVVQLRQQLGQFESERNVLLTTCSLVCGALYPLYARTATLSAQRNLLQEQVTKLEAFRLSVQKLVSALSMNHQPEPKGSVRKARREMDEEAPKISPLLRFRKAVITVLAANRLVHFSKGHCRLFTAHDVLPGLYTMSVCTGGIQPMEKVFKGVSSYRLLGEESMSLVTPDKAVNWLTSGELLSAVMSTMSELQPLLLKARENGSSSIDYKILLKTVQSSFTKLLCHLPASFSSVSVTGDGGHRDRPLLVRTLGNGLRRIIGRTAINDRESIVNSQATFSALQAQVLDFTKRLHAVEVDRRDLRMEMTTIRQERNNWKSSVANTEHISAQLTNFKDKVDSMVSRNQFEGVCRELEQALNRERQAQEILQEQTRQLHTLSERYERTAQDGSHKEQNLTDSLQNLSEARQDLKRHEQMVRQLNRQVGQLEHEKKMLNVNVNDAENAIRTAAKDKELVATYVKAVERTIDRCKITNQQGPIDLTPILSPELVPRGSGRAGPELAACQLLVTSFVDAQAQLNNRIRSLQQEVSSHKSHVGTLKRELSAACKRELEDDVPFQYSDSEPTKEIITKTTIQSPREGRNMNNFIPLTEDSQDSFTALPRATLTNSMRSKYIKEKPAKTKKTTKAKKTVATNKSTKDKSSLLSRSAATHNHRGARSLSVPLYQS